MKEIEFKEKIIASYNNISDILNNQTDLGYDYDIQDKLNTIYTLLTEIVMEIK